MPDTELANVKAAETTAVEDENWKAGIEAYMSDTKNTFKPLCVHLVIK